MLGDKIPCWLLYPQTFLFVEGTTPFQGHPAERNRMKVLLSCFPNHENERNSLKQRRTPTKNVVLLGTNHRKKTTHRNPFPLYTLYCIHVYICMFINVHTHKWHRSIRILLLIHNDHNPRSTTTFASFAHYWSIKSAFYLYKFFSFPVSKFPSYCCWFRNPAC